MIGYEAVMNCPLCGTYRFEGKGFVPFESFKKINGGAASYAECHCCGAVFHSERLTEEATKKFYEGLYRKLLVQQSDEPTTTDINREVIRGRKTLRLIKEKLGDNFLSDRTAVDIGSSTGALVVGMLMEGSEAVGIEPGKFGDVSKEKLGITVEKDISDCDYDMFDFVTMVHTLEHINEPRAYLTELQQYTMPEAVLYIEVPDLIGNSHGLGSAHPFMFTKKTLKETLLTSGWKPIHLWGGLDTRMIKTPFKINLHCIAVKCEPKEKPSKDYFPFEKRLIAREVNRWWTIRTIRRMKRDAEKQKKAGDTGGDEVVSEVQRGERGISSITGLPGELRVLPEVQEEIPTEMGQESTEAIQEEVEAESGGCLRGQLSMWGDGFGHVDDTSDCEPPRVS